MTNHNKPAEGETKKLPMRSLIRSDDVQPRDRVNYDAIGRYKAKIKNASQNQTRCDLPPVLVGNVPMMGYVLIDGYHRCQAYEEAGLKRIEAKIVDCTWEEALWLAAEANLKHGVPLKKGDHRGVFRRYVDSGRAVSGSGFKSTREIAKELGDICSHVSIWKWAKEDYPHILTGYVEPMEDTTEKPEGARGKSHEVRAIEDYVRGIAKRVRESVKRRQQEDRAQIMSSLGLLVSKMAEAYGEAERVLIGEILEQAEDKPL